MVNLFVPDTRSPAKPFVLGIKCIIAGPVWFRFPHKWAKLDWRLLNSSIVRCLFFFFLFFRILLCWTGLILRVCLLIFPCAPNGMVPKSSVPPEQYVSQNVVDPEIIIVSPEGNCHGHFRWHWYARIAFCFFYLSNCFLSQFCILCSERNLCRNHIHF